MVHIPTATEYITQAVKLGYEIFDSLERPYNLNIVGWRNKKTRPDYFDDFLTVYWQDFGGWAHKTWPITTYPGLPNLFKPVNPRGAAILVPGQYKKSYILGRYKSSLALKQHLVVQVYRDSNLNGQFDLNPDTIEEGLFGIHIHKAGWWNKLVGVSSAGCQVFQKKKDFEEFIELCEKAAFHWGKFFTYTLMEL